MTEEGDHEAVTVADLEERLEDLEGRYDALNRARMHLMEQNEALKDRVAELEQVVDPDPEAVAYQQLTKAQKVHRVRKTLAENAARSANGKDAMKYKAVMMLFDGHPSAGHCYDLMERAGELDGYAYDETADGTKRIRVNITAVNDETLVHAVNNATGGGTV